ncbi:POTRA domain-containing protein [Desmonostoc muscorum]|uniref:POTRA domain-containing protein n=1 Tax=Desmonostoc muscorum TaxID=1179 RepID=UPI0035A10BA3
MVVTGAEGELENQVYDVIRTKPGMRTTKTQLQEDINAIFGTGYFSNVQAVPTDTPLGVRVTAVKIPNPVLKLVTVKNAPTLPKNVIQDSDFSKPCKTACCSCLDSFFKPWSASKAADETSKTLIFSVAGRFGIHPAF